MLIHALRRFAIYPNKAKGTSGLQYMALGAFRLLVYTVMIMLIAAIMLLLYLGYT